MAGGGGSGEGDERAQMLFDHKRDRQENKNVASEKKHSKAVKKSRAFLNALRHSSTQ